MESVYSTDHKERQKFNFIIEPGAGQNWLVTQFEGNLVQINLSSEDLSGNITYQDLIYDFNLTQIAPPFVASEIDLGNDGLAHCSFASYGLMHCTHLDKKGLVVNYIFKKHEMVYADSWLKRNWQRILISSAFVLIPLITRQAQQRMVQKEAIRQYQEKQKLAQQENNKDKNNDENNVESTNKDNDEEKDEAKEENQNKNENPPNEEKIKTE